MTSPENKRITTSKTLHISSQFLADSSLAFDVNKLDCISFQKTNEETPGTSDHDRTTNEIQMLLEEDVVNNHPCMETVMFLLHHMVDLGIISTNNLGCIIVDVPIWMKMFHDTYLDQSVIVDIKYFITKLILNCKEIFKPYASLWMPNLLNFISTTQPPTGLFFTTLMHTISQWFTLPHSLNGISKPELNKFVQFLANRCNSDNPSVNEINLEVYSNIIKSLNGEVEIPYRSIFENIQCTDSNTRSNTKLRMLALSLTYKYPFISEMSQENKILFMKPLLKNLKHKTKNIFASTFEICGMIMALLDHDIAEELQQEVTSSLEFIYSRNVSDYVTCLALVTKNYPEYSQTQYNILFSIMKKMNDDDLSKSLEILGNSLANKEYWLSLCKDLLELGVFDNIHFRPSHIIVRLLQIVRQTIVSILQSYDDEDGSNIIMNIFEHCLLCSNHEDNQVRSIFFQLVIDLASKEQDITVQSRILSSLLIGIVDPDKDISQSVRNFCSCPPRLPTQALLRAIRILEILFPMHQNVLLNYNPLNRHKFLALATNLLLEMTSHSPDFIRPLFDKGLDSNICFEMLSAAQMNTQTSRSMLPDFITPHTLKVVSHDKMFKVPSSKNVPSTSKNFDWIKVASTLKWSNDISSKNTLTEYVSEWPSSQIPGLDTGSTIQSSFLSLTTSKHDENQNIEKSPYKIDQSLHRRLEKTIQKKDVSTKNDSDFYRRRTIENQRQRERKSVTTRNLKQSAVFLYRNYRTGKVPDIQIQNCSIITSLQMLSQFNEEFAGDMFSHLYDRLLTESSLVLNASDFQENCVRMTNCLNNILSTCKLGDKYLVASCLTIATNQSSILPLRPKVIYEAATLTNNEIYSIILLEKYVINECRDNNVVTTFVEPSAKRLRRSDNEVLLTVAPFLMRLYKSLDLNEEIIGLLNLHIVEEEEDLTERFRLALESDCKENYNQSFKIYNRILTEIPSYSQSKSETFHSEILSVSEEGLINSLKKLSKWSDLTSFLEQHHTYNTNIKSVTSKAVVNSKFRLLLDQKDDLSDVMGELETLLNTDGSPIYERDFLMPLEMATFNILNGDMAKANHYCKLSCKQVLSSLNSSCFHKDVKVKQLQNMQILHEMSEFINTTDFEKYLLLVEKWNQRMPDKAKDSVEFWEELFFYRRTYLQIIKKKLLNKTEVIESCLFQLQLKYIDACISQKSILPALNTLQHCRLSSNKLGDECKLSWYIRYGNAWLQSAPSHGRTVPTEDLSELTTGICNSLLHLGKLTPPKPFAFGIEYQCNVTVGDCYWTLANIVKNHWQTIINSRIKDTILKVMASDIDLNIRDQTMSYFFKQSFYNLEKLLSNFKDTENERNKKEMSDALMVLSDFCDSQIAMVDDDATFDISPSIYHCFIESTLLSMNIDHFSAKNKFPRVLQVSEQIWDSKCQSIVADICSSIPSWMFLPWLDQMMTYLFSQKSSLIYEILLRITSEYPHALFFPFHLRMKDDLFKSPLIERIQHNLSSLRLMQQFYMALHEMLQPEDHLLAWLEESAEKFQCGIDESTRISIQEKYRNIFKEVFGCFQDSSLIPEKGLFHQAFINQFQNQFVDFFQEDGVAILSLSQQEFNSIRVKLKEKLNEWKSNSTNPKTLKSYTPWFTNYELQLNFHEKNMNTQNWLEVPGQYTNVTSRPFPEQHVKIFNFDPTIEILPSKQKPKKIKIIGDNEQYYHFLIKSGEDLRQDFRIEQLFNVMNVMLSQESRLMSNLRLSQLIVTFNVIPVSKVLGILEWVANTVVLRDFLLKTLTIEEKRTIEKLKNEHYSRYKNYSSYTTSWFSEDVEEPNESFITIQRSLLDLDLLRRSFMIISKNNESFFRLRIKFIQQYAVTVAAHYILGIGDRHPLNFLIDESSGNIIGIDFGYSFGVSSIVLPIPELIPFRLTSSFIAFMRPAGVGGLFSQTLDNVLLTFESNQSTIMSILQVFLSDQIIDWNRLSKAVKQSGEAFTRKRIAISRKKLLRKSPLSILLEELNIIYGKDVWFEKFSYYCTDRLKREDVTKELVAMASDAGLLARTFSGWDPLL